jgi:hypothetical protein
VGVEKLDLSKLAEKTLRQEAPQTTFLIFLDIFYPPNFRCLEKNGVFQQPLPFTLIDGPGAQIGGYPPKTKTPETLSSRGTLR